MVIGFVCTQFEVLSVPSYAKTKLGCTSLDDWGHHSESAVLFIFSASADTTAVGPWSKKHQSLNVSVVAFGLLVLAIFMQDLPYLYRLADTMHRFMEPSGEGFVGQ